jgi:hypothetical protein
MSPPAQKARPSPENINFLSVFVEKFRMTLIISSFKEFNAEGLFK